MKNRLTELITAAVLISVLLLPEAAFAEVYDESGGNGAQAVWKRQDKYYGGFIPGHKELYTSDTDRESGKNNAKKGAAGNSAGKKKGLTLQGEQDEYPSAYRSDEQPWAKNIRVKDQAGTGLCWAFYMTSCAEYSYAKELYEKTGEIYDGELSPGHTAQFFYNTVNDPLGNTEGDVNLWYDPDVHFSQRGNDVPYVMQHMATWSGAVLESEAPFNKITDHLVEEAYGYNWDGSPDPYSDDLVYGHNKLTMEEGSYFKSMDPADFKPLLLEYGACGIAMGFSDFRKNMNLNEIDPETGEPYPDGRSFYNHKSYTGFNHALTLIGWDDSYPKENFRHEVKEPKRDEDGWWIYENGKPVYETKEVMPEHDGAWIIQNSWGTEPHEKGILYASYDSIDFNYRGCEVFVLDMQPADTYKYNFMYDGSAGCHDASDPAGDSEHQPFWTEKGTSAANIFTNTTGNPITVEAVGYTEYNKDSTESEVSVYTGIKDPTDPESGVLRGTSHISSTTAGCKTGKLSRPVIVNPGEQFSVVFHFNSDMAFGFESSFSDGIQEFNAHVDPGQSFFKPLGSGSRWKDMYNYDACFRIKAFANDSDKIRKEDNPMAVTGKTAKVSYKSLARRHRVISPSKVMTVTGNKGKVTYRKKSGDPKISIASDGKVTLRWGLKKKTYTVKVKVTAAGNAYYKPVTRVVQFRIKVK